VIVPDRVRLPLHFDVPSLAFEAAEIPPESWVPHFNQGIYDGSWTGVALRSVGGAAMQLYPDPSANAAFMDTELLDRCPALRSALAQFCCPVMAARLLALAPGAVIKEHRDLRLRWEDGEVRIHVAIATDDEVEFVLDGHTIDLGPGEAWYLDLTLPHRAANRSGRTRVHLVVDCVVDDWLRDLMRRALSGSSDGHGQGDHPDEAR
jgi:hypothetical protein